MAALFRSHELAFRTQYAELKERVGGAGPLLPGTPGTLARRTGTGHAHWYRVYYAAPGRQVEDWVGAEADAAAREQAGQDIAFASWASLQVADLRKLGFQVADKGTARVLVELHNRGLFAAGLVVVGTLAVMAWLNELGARAVAARTMDVDLARRQALRIAGPSPLLDILRATRLPFAAVPAMPSHAASTSAKLPGADGLRVDLLAPGRATGGAVAVPELAWHAQAIPHYDWLLDDPSPAVVLAGGHAVPVRLPRPERMVFHKLLSSVAARRPREKVEKDVVQAATLAACLVEDDDVALGHAAATLPAALRSAARRRRADLERLLADHPQALEALAPALR